MIGGIAIIAAMDGAWIPKRLVALNSAGRKKNQAGLARALDVPDARITEIIQEKGKRALNLSEVPECARYLELSWEMVVALATGMDPAEMTPNPPAPNPIKKAQTLGEIIRHLIELDQVSIRRIREHLAAQTDGPPELALYEEQANTLRQQLRAVLDGGNDD